MARLWAMTKSIEHANLNSLIGWYQISPQATSAMLVEKIIRSWNAEATDHQARELAASKLIAGYKNQLYSQPCA